MTPKKAKDLSLKTPHTGKHEAKHKQLVNEYITHIIQEQKEMLGDLANLVPFKNDKVPYLFLVCTGRKTPCKIDLVSKTIWLWISKKKNTKNKSGWLEPGSMMTYLKTFMAEMDQVYGWKYNLLKDFNFKGGLAAGLDDMFQSRNKADCTYGIAKIDRL